MTPSRDKILNKLRAARRPFPDAPPRPKHYAPVTDVDDDSPDALLGRFSEIADADVRAVDGDDAAREAIMDLLREKGVNHVLAWHFTQIPVRGLKGALEAADMHIEQPDVRDEFRMETLESAREAGAGLTGVDALAATTGTLIVSSGRGRGRIPTMLPPLHIAVARLDQLVGRLEDWVAGQRADDLQTLRASANVAFISGPSATADIEMVKVLGVHGPGELVVLVKR